VLHSGAALAAAKGLAQAQLRDLLLLHSRVGQLCGWGVGEPVGKAGNRACLTQRLFHLMTLGTRAGQAIESLKFPADTATCQKSGQPPCIASQRLDVKL
jgi:hypothetical protein